MPDELVEEMQCCEPDCGLPAVYEVWPRGMPKGFEAYCLLQGEPFNGYCWFEAYTHACAQHLEEAKAGCAEAEVVHLSRAGGDKVTVAIPAPEPARG